MTTSPRIGESVDQVWSENFDGVTAASYRSCPNRVSNCRAQDRLPPRSASVLLQTHRMPKPVDGEDHPGRPHSRSPKIKEANEPAVAIPARCCEMPVRPVGLALIQRSVDRTGSFLPGRLTRSQRSSWARAARGAEGLLRCWLKKTAIRSRESTVATGSYFVRVAQPMTWKTSGMRSPAPSWSFMNP